MFKNPREYFNAGVDFIPVGSPDLIDGIDDYINDVLNSNWLTTGEKVNELENLFIELIDCKYACAVSSCTSGIELILRSLNLEHGDEILVPNWTFVSVANVVESLGLSLVLVDCDLDNYNLDKNDLKEKITSKTRVLIIPHYSGILSDVEYINDLRTGKNIFIIEDCAHSIGSSFNNIQSGNFFDAGVFSFYANKTISAGEGGMITTNNQKLYEKVYMTRLHGMTKDAINRYRDTNNWEYDVPSPGLKANLTDIQASIGINQLKHIDFLLKKRKEKAEFYTEKLSKYDFIRIFSRDENESWWNYPLSIKHQSNRVLRDQLIEYLNSKGIGTSVHFKPIHKFSYYQNKYHFNDKDFPNCTAAFNSTLSIPLFASLNENEQIYILNCLDEFFNKNLAYFKGVEFSD